LFEKGIMIYQEGKVNPNCTLVDVGLQGVKGVMGLYYIRSNGKSCLIDSGEPKGAKRVIQKLKSMGEPLPDMILLTHAHWDHSQGVPAFRKKQPFIQVLASDKSIDLLADQSFNKIFNGVTDVNIYDVDPLKKGETIDIGTIKLKTVDLPGHTYDHIGYYDEISKIMFVGDSIGIRVGERAYIPPSMPPYFNENDYLNTLDRLKEMDIETLCLAHFGYVPHIEIQSFLEEMRTFYLISKRVFQRIIDKPYLEKSLTQLLLTELDMNIPDLEVYDKKIPIVLGFLNGFRKLAGKKSIKVGDILTPKFGGYALTGYKMSLED